MELGVRGKKVSCGSNAMDSDCFYQDLVDLIFLNQCFSLCCMPLGQLLKTLNYLKIISIN